MDSQDEAPSIELPAGPVAERVYAALREAILTLELVPNQELSENGLCRLYGVSRTPTRQALKRLELEGLVLSFPQRKTIVTPLELRTYRQYLLAREALEVMAASEASRMPRRRAELPLTQHLDPQLQAVLARDYGLFDELDRRFHAAVLLRARLPHLTALVSQVRGLLDRVRAAHEKFLEPRQHLAVVEQHHQIAEAIEAGDASLAAEAMSAHVRSALERIRKLVLVKPDLFERPLAAHDRQFLGLPDDTTSTAGTDAPAT